MLDIKQKRTSGWHPACDGLSERLMRTLIKMIKSYISAHHKDWDEKLESLAFAYNTARHASTKFTPYFLFFGRHPKVPANLFLESPIIALPLNHEEYAAKMERCLKDAYGCVRRNCDVKMQYNKDYHERKNVACEFKKGDKVYARAHIVPKGLVKKFYPKWRREQFTVLAQVGEANYLIRPLKGKGKLTRIHRENLKRCTDPMNLEYNNALPELPAKKRGRQAKEKPTKKTAKEPAKVRGRPRKLVPSKRPQEDNEPLPELDVTGFNDQEKESDHLAADTPNEIVPTFAQGKPAKNGPKKAIRTAIETVEPRPKRQCVINNKPNYN